MDWKDEAKAAVTEFPADVKAFATKTYDIIKNDNDPGVDPQRRNVLQAMGVAAAGGFIDFAEDGDLDSVDYAADLGSAAAGEAGEAWDALGEAIPYEIRSPITRKDGGSPGTTTPEDTTTPEENTPTPEDTTTPEENTTTPEDTTTPTPELEYDSISEGLLEEGETTRDGFMGYSLVALDEQLEGVDYQEAVLNAEDYEASIMDALEGTDYEDGEFRLGEYGINDERPEGRTIDLTGEFGASDKLDSYMENLDERGELEDQMFGYFDSLERSDL